MKTIRSVIFFVVAFLFGNFSVWALDPPDPLMPPPAPEFPIDGNLVQLFIVAVFFGFYKIYISTIKKKRSI